MNGRQERIVSLYVYLTLALTVILLIVGSGAAAVMGILHLFRSSYSPKGSASDIRFTDAVDIQAFIPCVRHPNLAYPLICADVKQFDPMYLPFELATEASYEAQSLASAAEFPGFGEDERKALFSQVKYYHPPSILEESAKFGESDSFSAPPTKRRSSLKVRERTLSREGPLP